MAARFPRARSLASNPLPGDHTSLFRKSRAAVLLLLAAGSLTLGNCAPAEESEPAERELPEADRESWDVSLDIREPGLRVRVRAPYLVDYVDEEVARADSGVKIAFLRDDGSGGCRVSAARMTLRHGDGQYCCGGRVRLTAGDSLALEADSLVWDRESGQLRVPGSLHIDSPSGRERGRSLLTDVDVSSWTMEQVSGVWQGTGPGDDYRVKIEAARERGQRAEGYRIEYDSVAVTHDGTHASGNVARFLEAEARLIFPHGVRGRDPRYRFVADQGTVELSQDLLRAAGQVVFTMADTAGRTGFQVHAATVGHNRRQDVLTAAGEPVHFRQEQRWIQADSLQYERQAERVLALGNVVYQDSLARLETDTLLFARNEGQVDAGGGIRLESSQLEGTLHGRRLIYSTGSSIAELEGTPVLERAHKDSPVTSLRADAMRINLRDRVLKAQGNVVLRAPEAVVRAGRACLREATGELLLAGPAELVQEGGQAGRRTEVRADSMRIELVEGNVAAVDFPGALSSRIRSSDGSVDWISGSSGRLHLNAERVERLEIGAAADVTHRASRRHEVSRFGGDRMVLEFDGHGLRRAWVVGGAELVSRLRDEEAGDEEGLTRVSGEELEVLFQDDGMEVRIGPQVDGQYYRDEQE